MSFELLKADVIALRKDISRDSRWAFRACELTRSIVKRLLGCWPSPEDVKEILDMLKGLPDEVRNVKKEGPFADRIEDFAKSIEWRIHDLQSYVDWNDLNKAPTPPPAVPSRVHSKLRSLLSIRRQK